MVLGIVNVWLAVRRSVWNFPVAIVSVTLVGWIVYRERLYSDALLQMFFVLANIYGWMKWRRAATREAVVPVERMGRGRLTVWIVGCIAAASILAWLTDSFTDAARPWWDAPTFATSIAAQILMGQRKLENWFLWIAVDLGLIPLYFVQHLYGLAALYVVYLILSIWGWVEWHRAWAADRQRSAFA